MKNKLKSLIYKLYILLNQKSYKMQNGKNIKYIFLKRKSNELIISFSGFSGKGQKAKYNYIKTLKKVQKNQIYILDDFGYEKAGTYYLGENGSYFLQKEIQNLIKKIKEKNNIEKIYTIGTSKGAWASLYYGILLNCNKIICGAPQYYIGNYLNSSEYHKNILQGIIGNNKEQIKLLNEKLENAIKQNDIQNIKFIIHYSKKEHTYEEHIKYLLQELKNKNADIEEDIQDYLKHEEVGIYFKKLLSQVFNI